METKGKELTHMQITAINAYVRDGGRSKAKALLEAGYSMAIVRQPHKVFGSSLVQAELETRGFGRSVGKVMDDEITLRVVERPHVDFSKVPKEQIQQLKDMLIALPGAPLRLGAKEEDASPYVPRGNGVDIFSNEAKEATARPKHSSFSAM